MSISTLNPVKTSPVRDVYRFGDGPEPVLRPGTMGWTASEMEDPDLHFLWDQGRYEIIDGVLTVMPPAFFIGGSPSFNLGYLLRTHFRKQKVSVSISTEVDLRLSEKLLLRGDLVAVFGDDVSKFQALEFSKGGNDWRKHALAIPPTLVIESISERHETHDRKSKRKWYAEFGVSRYWIVDAYTRSLECLLLQEGQYVDDGMGRDNEVVNVASLAGLAISLAEIWGE
jgi:Uma2 family endonuclease